MERSESRLRTSPPTPPTSRSTVVLEDEALMVIDKPAGVVVHPGAGRRTGTLAQALRGQGRRGT